MSYDDNTRVPLHHKMNEDQPMATISPENMSVADKLALMETLWTDLCNHSQIDSPDWHAKVLAARQQQREQGNQQPMDWAQAKEQIRNRVK